MALLPRFFLLQHVARLRVDNDVTLGGNSRRNSPRPESERDQNEEKLVENGHSGLEPQHLNRGDMVGNTNWPARIYAGFSPD